MTVFAAIDHCNAVCIGIHAIKRAHRFEALEPIRQAVREQFGSFSAGEAARGAAPSRSRQCVHERRFPGRGCLL